MSEPSMEYSLPGVLHYLQAEWRKFEREKNEWAIERAELQARIALLEGERRGVENIKLTMMKRVKMLEYALRQERKRHAGVTATSEDANATAIDTTTTTTPIITNTNDSNENTNIPTKPDIATSSPSIVDNKLREKSREVLRSCLQEINYLTSFPNKLPLTNALSNSTNRSLSAAQTAALNERSSSIRRAPPPPSGSTNSPVLVPASLSAASSNSSPSLNARYKYTPDQQQERNQKYTPTNDRQKSVLSVVSPKKNSNSTNFVSSPIPKKSTLQHQQQRQEQEEKDEDNMEVPANVDEVAMINNIKEETENYNNTHQNASMATSSPSQQQQDNNESLSMQIQEKFHLSEEKVAKLLKHATGNSKQKSLQQEDRLLAGDFDPNQIGDIDSQQQMQPKIWKARVTIKGHLDSVRAVCFHPNEMVVASGSDDGTVKIWNLQRTTGKDGTAIKKGSLEEADPSITFRGHTNVVTAVVISAKQNRVYSASLDSTIRVWSLPSDDRGPFAPVDPSLNIATYVGHTDAIWDFKLSQNGLLASASADGTVKIWDTESSGSLLKSSWTFDGVSNEEGITRTERAAPTSLDFCPKETDKVVVSFANAKIRMYDLETGQVLMTFKGSDETFDNTFSTQINCIVAHPSLPIIVSGHEDRHIKFYDIKTGECIQSVSGHLDAVTSLDIDSTGKTMVSGGQDSSIRLWDLTNKTCIQEFSAHRRKGDEGVLSVKFHHSFPWMVSGGADGIVKIYHHGH